MRIAFLSVSAEMGGSETCLVQLVRAIRASDAAAMLHVVLPRSGPLEHAAREAGCDTHVLPMPASLARFGESGTRGFARTSAALLGAAVAARGYRRDLRDTLSAIAPDIVHSNGFKFHVLASRARPRTAALVWHLHEFVSPRPLTCRLLRHHVGSVDAIVANSVSVAQDASAALHPGVPVERIYNGIDLAEFAPAGDVADLDALAGAPPLPRGALRVGLVGTFGRWKGHEVFLRALARLQASTPLRGYIVGDALYETAGSQYSRQELERLAGALGIRAQVAFTGYVPRTAPVLRALDVVVHASTQPEPFGLVIAEAMACGRAVIASAAGGAAELVGEGCDALTHAPGDVDGLASALGRLAGDAALRARLGTAARATAEARFDAARFGAAFLDLYGRLMDHAMAEAR